MGTLINTDSMPGDGMDPYEIELAAGHFRSIGSSVSAQGGTVLDAWQKISGSYQAPEQQLLFTSMNPVKTDAEAFGTDCGTAATALEVFAGEVRTIQSTVSTIRVDAATFKNTITDGEVEVTGFSRAGRTTHHEAWDENTDANDTNNALIGRTNDAQEKLWAAERTCANAIYDIIGHAHINAASESNPNGYGVDDIPEGTEMPWGAAADEKESCGESVFNGVVIDGLGGLAEGITSLTLGMSWSGPDGFSIFNGDTYAHAWTGMGHLATGLSMVANPVSLINLAMPGPTGDWYRDSGKSTIQAVTGLISIDPFAEDPVAAWKENGWRTGASSVFNIGTFFVPGGQVSGALKGTKGARAAELAADGTRLAEGASALSRLSDLARGAIKVDVPTLDALKSLFGRDGKLDLHTHVDVDVPTIPKHDVDTGTPHVGDHDAPPPRDPEGATGSDHGTGDHASDHTPDHGTSDHGDTGADHGAGDHGTGAGHDPRVGTGDGTQQSPRVYEYDNPAESLRGSEQPTAAQLDDIGSHRDYTPGTSDHMTARWNEYQAKGGDMGWDAWRDTYIRNQGHNARGLAYEDAFFDSRGLSADEWSRNTSVQDVTGVDRNYDIVSAADQSAYELKSGAGIDARQLIKDQQLVDAGWDVHYVFGKEPSAATITKLEDAGVTWEVFYGEPVLAPVR